MNTEPEHFDFDEEMPDAESAIDSVLGENPRARELAEMIAALAQRRAALLREADRATSANERLKLEAKLAELNMQLKVLRDELAITDFVENSVRATIKKPSSRGGEVDDDW